MGDGNMCGKYKMWNTIYQTKVFKTLTGNTNINRYVLLVLRESLTYRIGHVVALMNLLCSLKECRTIGIGKGHEGELTTEHRIHWLGITRY